MADRKKPTKKPAKKSTFASHSQEPVKVQEQEPVKVQKPLHREPIKVTPVAAPKGPTTTCPDCGDVREVSEYFNPAAHDKRCASCYQNR